MDEYNNDSHGKYPSTKLIASQSKAFNLSGRKSVHFLFLFSLFDVII